MNKQLHRIVFNAARGLRMVVQETARSAGKAASGATWAPGSKPNRAAAPVLRAPHAIKVIASLLALLQLTPSLAQIRADLAAPATLRPQVLVAPNGVPLVNITTPSAAGVSRNVYSQFDVNGNGAILNNSRTDAQTQLGGWVQGNPWLANGPARVILNEVYSANPSQLRGYVEVAGQRAEVVIANPAGIQVDGGGFINASQVTLSTGAPQLNALGGLDSFLVRGGTISIDGAGLDLSRTDYAAILARAVQVNAGIWASELKVVTGANEVSADHAQITPTAGNGSAPVFALDVSQLGGMYAGKITLIGTEAGLGVRNAGTLIAANGSAAGLAGVGQLVVTSAGRLENIGTIQASQDASLSATALSNSGSIASGATLKVATQGDLANTSGTLEAQSLQLASAAGDIDNRNGTLRQTSYAGLTLVAPSLSNSLGGVIGSEPLPTSPTGVGGGTSGSTDPTPSTTASGSATSGASTPTPAPVPPAPGAITAAGTLRNDGGRIYAGGPIALQTPQLNNAGGSLNVATLSVAGPSFSNAGGTLNVSQSFQAHVSQFDNTGGTLHAGGLAIATTGDLINQDGTLTSDSDATLTVGRALNNAGGTISAAGALSANVAGAADNSAGSLIANQSVSIAALALNNSQGAIQSAQAGVALTVARQLLNTEGSIAAATDLVLRAGSLSSSGSLRGANDVTVAVGSALSNDGSITAGRHATITADSLQSGSASVLGAGIQADGSLGAAGDLSVTATHALAANGTNLAAGNATLQGTSVDLSESQTSAANISITATQGNVTTSQATVVTPGTLAIAANAQANQTFVNTAGQISAGQLELNASNISNTEAAEIVQTGAGTARIRASGAIDNSAGTLAGNGDVILRAGSLSNRSGTLRSTGTSNLDLTVGETLDNSAGGEIGAGANATLRAGSLNNDTGSITAVGDLVATIGAGASNQGGTLAANRNTTLSAASLYNGSGTMAAVSGNLNVSITGATINASGKLQAGADVVLVNGGLDNTLGNVTGNRLSVDTQGGTLTNSQGAIGATTTVNLASGALGNDAGLIQSGGAMAIDTHGQALTNTHAAGHASRQGGITSADTLALSTGAVHNTAGFIGSKSALNASTGSFTNAAGGLVLGQAAVTIDTHGAGYDNRGGQTQALGDLRIDAGAIDNTSGLIRSIGTVTLSAATIVNAATQGADQGIEGKNVAIGVDNLVNTVGAIRADVHTTITSGGSVNNTGGLISAKDTLKIANPQGGGALVLTNTNGTLVADNSIQLAVARTTLDGKVLSANDLSISASEDIVVAAGSQTVANGNLSLSTRGNVTNAGKISAGQALTLEANDIDNAATGEISSRQTTISAQGRLTNRGLIDGQTTRITAGSLTNTGTGRIYGDQLSIQAGTLDNMAATVNGVTSSATIAARERLDIGVGSLNNRDGALIFSAGDLHVGAAIGADGKASGQAGVINNHAATIEALGQINIDAATLNNTNGGVSYTMVDGPGQRVLEFALQGTPTRFSGEQLVLGRSNPDYAYNGQHPMLWPSFSAVPASNFGNGDTEHFYLVIPQLTAFPYDRYQAYYLNPPRHSADRSGFTCTGGDAAQCTDYASAGYWYPASDPIWATFGVAPPPVLPDYLRGLKQEDAVVGSWGRTLPPATPGGDPIQVNYDHALTQAEYDALASYQAAHRALDTVTTSFMASIVGQAAAMPYAVQPVPSSGPGMTNGYSYWDYVETSRTPVLQSSAPGRIIAGGAMNLRVGSGRNDMSQIVAGGTLSVTGGSIVNEGLTADAELRQVGLTGTTSGAGDFITFLNVPYDHTIRTTVTLAAARQEGNAAAPGSGAAIGALTTGSVASGTAQGTGGGTPGTRVTPILEVPAAVNTLAPAAGAGSGASGRATGSLPTVVRTTTPAAAVPSASLFRVRPDARGYLVETDPRFTNHRDWLGSDYLLNSLGLDPDTMLRRLGDGNVEQRLIRDQVMQLTGQRYLDGFSSDADQYAALMNAGITFAQQYHLSPGVALSAEQMAQLTSDMVWLVEQDVALPDGSHQRVLVPQVYVRVRPGDIDGSGALLAGRSVDIRLSGDLSNASGTIAGRQAVNLGADTIANLGGRISGASVSAKAQTDLLNIGGIIDAQNAVALEAGRDIRIETTTRSSTTANAASASPAQVFTGTALGASARSDTVIDRVAGIHVSNPGGTLVASAGRDIHLVGAIVANLGAGGSVRIDAGRDLNLETVTTASSEHTDAGLGYTRTEANLQQTGSRISAVGDIELQAGRDLNASAAHIASSQGNVAIGARNDVTIVPGVQQMQLNGHAGLQEDDSKSAIAATHALASTIMAAGDVSIAAGRDLTVIGSTIAAGADAQTQAAIVAAAQPIDYHAFDPARGVVGLGQGQPGNDEAYNHANYLQGVAQGSGGVPVQPTSTVPLAPVAPASGSLSLSAGRDLVLATSADSASSESRINHGGGNFQSWEGSSVSVNAAHLSGANVTLKAQGDITSIASQVDANTLSISTPGTLNLLTATGQENRNRDSRDHDAWFVGGGSVGSKHQSTAYNQFNASNISISAGSINAQVSERDSLSQLAQQPGMGWINQLQNAPTLAGQTQWQRVREVHEQWDNTYSAIGPGTAAIISLIVGFVAFPAAAGAGAAAGDAVALGVGQGMVVEGATFLSTTGATLSSAVGSAVQAGISSIASQATVSLINNNGNIGAVLHDLGSRQGIRNIATAMVTAGALDFLGDIPIGGQTVGTASLRNGASGLELLGANMIRGAAGAVVNTAINGGSLERNLGDAIAGAFISTGAALGANQIGQWTSPGVDPLTGAQTASAINRFAGEGAHAIVGCAAGVARVDRLEGCAAGAIGAVVGHLAGQSFNPFADQNVAGQTIAIGSLVGGIAGAVVGGDAQGAYIGAAAGANAVENNLLSGRQRAQANAAIALAQVNHPDDDAAFLPPWMAVPEVQQWAATDQSQQAVVDELAAASNAYLLAAPPDRPAASARLTNARANAVALQDSFGDDQGGRHILASAVGAADSARRQSDGQATCNADLANCITAWKGMGSLATGASQGLIRWPIDLVNAAPTAVNGYGYVVQWLSGDRLDDLVPLIPVPGPLEYDNSLAAFGGAVTSAAAGGYIVAGAAAVIGRSAGTGSALSIEQTGASAGTAGDALVVAPKPTYVFRGDGRPSAQIFDEGFKTGGRTNMDVLDHATTNSNSGLISTSSSPNVAREFADIQIEGYVYTIRKPPQALDVNAILRSKSPYPHELEIAIPSVIHPQDILGARQVGADGKFIGQFIKNPRFQ